MFVVAQTYLPCFFRKEEHNAAYEFSCPAISGVLTVDIWNSWLELSYLMTVNWKWWKCETLVDPMFLSYIERCEYHCFDSHLCLCQRNLSLTRKQHTTLTRSSKPISSHLLLVWSVRSEEWMVLYSRVNAKCFSVTPFLFGKLLAESAAPDWEGVTSGTPRRESLAYFFFFFLRAFLYFFEKRNSYLVLLISFYLI